MYLTFIRSESLREIVLFPTPAGPLRTTSNPGWCMAALILVCGMRVVGFHRPTTCNQQPTTRNASLHVLNLFLQSIDRPFNFYNMSGDLAVVGLAGDGIGLAEHLL